MHDHLLMLAKSKFNSIKTLIFQALIEIYFNQKRSIVPSVDLYILCKRGQ